MSEKINDGLTRYRRYQLRHPDRVAEAQKRYRAKNPEKAKASKEKSRAKRLARMTPEELAEEQRKQRAYWKAYREKHREHRKEIAKEWAKTQKCKEMRRRYYLEVRRPRFGIKDKVTLYPGNERNKRNRELWRNYSAKNRVKRKGYYKANRDKLLAKLKESYPQRKARIIAGNNARTKKRKAVDVGFRILCNLRGRVSSFLRGKSRSMRSRELIGCDTEHLRNHLEVQFTEGMTWENYGRFGWHVDHIKPLTHYDMTDLEQQKAAFHWTNLQPLWASENSSKGNRFAGKPLDARVAA